MAAWLGFALAALFFYPLVVTLDSDSYYLHWRSGDILEVAVALGLLTLVAGIVVYATWLRHSLGSTAVLVATAALPMASLLAGVARQLPFDNQLIAAWENPIVRLALPLAVTAGLLGFFAARPEAAGRATRRLLVIVSPISLVVLVTLALSTRIGSIVRAIDRPPDPVQAVASSCAPVLALLFDELSFSYLYDANDVAPAFPRLAEFGAQATHYLKAEAPDRETLTSVPSLLAARRLRDVRVEGGRISVPSEQGPRVPLNVTGDEALFTTARSLGFRNEVAGYYLAYCELFGELTDRCRSFSFYNVSSTGDRFSVLDPVETTFILWPRQFPFGVFKARPFARHQRALVRETAAFAAAPMAADMPVFRFVHFSIPHLPFAFDAGGYHPPVDPMRTTTDEGYVHQLAYVDRLAGDLFDGLKRRDAYDNLTIVVLADHGYRFGGREEDPLHIPFIVKSPRQRERRIVEEPAGGEVLLKRVLQQSCTTS